VGAQVLALAAGGRTEPAELEFSVGMATRTGEKALSGYLPAQYPLVIYMRDWPVPPPEAQVLAYDEKGRVALWQLGRAAFGFSGHPGIKVGMIEDLIMEFEEGPANIESGLARLRLSQRSIEDALVPIMTGLVQAAGWMHGAA